RDLGERFAEERTESAGFKKSETGWIERNIAVLKKERRSVPDEPGGFPDFNVSELLRKTFRISSRRERFPRQDRRRGVMAVRFVVVRTETCHHDVRFPFPNRPDHIS